VALSSADWNKLDSRFERLDGRLEKADMERREFHEAFMIHVNKSIKMAHPPNGTAREGETGRRTIWHERADSAVIALGLHVVKYITTGHW